MTAAAMAPELEQLWADYRAMWERELGRPVSDVELREKQRADVELWQAFQRIDAGLKRMDARAAE